MLNCYRYEVVRRSDLRKIIIPFFRKNKLRLASKRKDFDLFSKLVDMMENNEHLTDKGIRKMYHIKQKMH